MNDKAHSGNYILS